MRLLALGLILTMFAASARAGPWPRDTGAVFLATGGSYRFDHGTGVATREATIYAEYGFGPRLTLGLDGMQVHGGAAQVIAFARVPLGPSDRRVRLAASFGTGAVRAVATGPWDPVARVSLSAGRDHALGRGGWWTVTATVDRGSDMSGALTKLDATFGIALNEDLQAMLQVETSHRSGMDAQLAVIPGVIWKTGPRVRLHLGLEARGTRSMRQTGLRLGIWRDF